MSLGAGNIAVLKFTMLQEYTASQPVGSPLHSYEGIVNGTRAVAWVQTAIDDYEATGGKV